MVSENYAKAYKEIIEILKYTKKADVKKIPKEKIILWKTNMDKDWNFTVDTNKNLEDQNILSETRAIIANIFYDYWATDYQRQRIDEKDKKNSKIQEMQKREKYNPDNIFKNRNIQPENRIEENHEEKYIAVIQEEKWYKKFFSIIKNFFKRKTNEVVVNDGNLKEIFENETDKLTNNNRYLDRDISEIGNLYIEAVLNLTGGFQNIPSEEKNRIFNFANIISEEYKKMIEHEDKMMAKEKIWIELRNKYSEYFDFKRFVMSNNSILNIDDKIKKFNYIFGFINNIEIVYGDITDMTVDVIVNAANKTLLGGGGVDGAIHRKAGIELYNACKELGGCNTGDAKITDGYKLNAKKIIHTVAPIWNNENIEENKKLLKQCYENSYKLAKETKLGTIAFPCLGMGVYQIPLEVGAFISLESAICNCMNFEKIYLVCYEKKEFDYYCTLLKEMKQL